MFGYVDREIIIYNYNFSFDPSFQVYSSYSIVMLI